MDRMLKSGMVTRALLAVGFLLAAAIPVEAATDFSETQLEIIRDGFTPRVAALFAAEKGRPLVRSEPKPPLGAGRAAFVREYSFDLVEFATRCLWLDESNAAANAALAENADYYLANPDAIFDKDNFHWHSEVLLRLIEFFGTHGSRRAGLLQPETEQKILESIWLYCRRNDSAAKPHTHLAEADHAASQTWFIQESENHHAQSFTTLWHFAKLARHRENFRDCRYDDGRTPAEHYEAWNSYAKLYLTERAKKGLFVEMMSVSYNTSLLKGIFNFYDFAEDPELKRKAGLFFDLYFAYWGQEQIHGVAGGGQSRIYSDINPKSSGLGYLFFGLGAVPKLQSELLTAMTTTYRPSLVVVDLACDRIGRGTYEVIQRPLGLAADRAHYKPPSYRLRTDFGGNLRYSYCTPDFILGTTMSDARPEADWTMISSQNRRHGILFEGDPVAVISPQCEAIRDDRAFNAQWSVQRKGTLICQKLNTHRGAGPMRVWFSASGLSAPVERDGWVLVESRGAYAAVRAVRGATHWVDVSQPVTGRWLNLADEFSPVILQVAQKSEFPSLRAFGAAVVGQEIEVQNDALSFLSISGDRFSFPLNFTGTPAINGTPVNYAPARALDSPYVQTEWNSGIVRLSKGARTQVLDFTEAAAPHSP